MDEREHEASLQRMFKSLNRELMRRLRRLLRNPADADEVAQEAWLTMWSHRDTIRENPEGFLFTVARNLASKRRASRANKPMLELETSEHELPPDLLTPEHFLATRQELDFVQKEFFNLSPAHQQVVLASLEGLGQVEIAEEMGISQATVSRQLQRALKLLRHAQAVGPQAPARPQTTSPQSGLDDAAAQFSVNELHKGGG